MAEVLGAVAGGVTLAALFKTCIDAFELIQISRHQEGDFRKLKLRLNIEKCRLCIWGEFIGLANTSDDNHDRPIDSVRFPDVVRDILQTVVELFHDSHKIQDKYGCRQAAQGELLNEIQDSPSCKLAATFSNFPIRSNQNLRTPKVIQNLTWVIHDRKKFGALVTEVKDLIDSLQGITRPSVPVTRQDRKMLQKIVAIGDAETLSQIAEVCLDDHPDVAEIASTKADTISSASSNRRRVDAWIQDVQELQETHEGWMSPDLESMTVTELKQKLLEMLQEGKKHERREREKHEVRERRKHKLRERKEHELTSDSTLTYRQSTPSFPIHLGDSFNFGSSLPMYTFPSSLVLDHHDEEELCLDCHFGTTHDIDSMTRHWAESGRHP
ncbi:hypothetical protein ACLMJK_008139 [Lecanora helva]